MKVANSLEEILAAWRDATGLSVTSPRGARRATPGFPLLSLAERRETNSYWTTSIPNPLTNKKAMIF
jgi:hypothetical protein